MSARCYNPSCMDEGTCSLADIGMCPAFNEIYEREKRNYVPRPPPMSQEDRMAHFAWERGNGPDPYTERS